MRWCLHVWKNPSFAPKVADQSACRIWGLACVLCDGDGVIFVEMILPFGVEWVDKRHADRIVTGVLRVIFMWRCLFG
jgi:hypothetical protein